MIEQKNDHSQLNANLVEAGVSQPTATEKQMPVHLPQDEMWQHFMHRQKAKMQREWNAVPELKVWWEYIFKDDGVNETPQKIAQDSQGRDPVFLSVIFNRSSILAEILKVDVDLSSKDKQGNTALHYAGGLGLDDIANMLMDHGSDENIKNVQGQTPAALALLCKNYSLAEHLGLSSQAKPIHHARTPQRDFKNFKKPFKGKQNSNGNRNFDNKEQPVSQDTDIDDDSIGLYTENAHLPPHLRPKKTGASGGNNHRKAKQTPFVANFSNRDDSEHRRPVQKYVERREEDSGALQNLQKVQDNNVVQPGFMGTIGEQEHSKLSQQVKIVYKKKRTVEQSI